MNKVIVPLNAFADQDVYNKGQAAFIAPIFNGGAYGVEIRRELIKNLNTELAVLKDRLKDYGLFVVYSAPAGLWCENGELNSEELELICQEASGLGASLLKVSLGNYQASRSPFDSLRELIDRWSPQLEILIENDQTDYGGRLEVLKDFFTTASNEGVSIEMTFDVGNWKFVNEEMDEALQALGHRVRYLHLKYVTERHGELVTLPLLEDEEEQWKQAAGQFSAEILKALEFPVQDEKDVAAYVEMVGRAGLESEDGVWKN
ncbi:sugar phosphate isomerase/epimerase [Halobacillus salinarum]|uniref:Sugar phosphate isomerase/epimerase n=1 Tax=Halobacillus salinarum TaxID=2932257 RepID=A0ABY4EKI1_9BACI|nr:sugar phosphate isomerase/epimerase [Halobacillus salinarum]UOQ44980.1 sugar phosphate isomerase/epimerase [Halobacillus salinarum]